MDFKEKYFGKLEQDLKDLREQLQGMEDRVEEKLQKDTMEIRELLFKLEAGMEKKFDQALSNIYGMTKSRQDDYLAVNRRLDSLADRMDKTTTWAARFAIGTFTAVAGLVIAVLLK